MNLIIITCLITVPYFSRLAKNLPSTTPLLLGCTKASIKRCLGHMHSLGLLVPLFSRWLCLLGLGEISTRFAL